MSSRLKNIADSVIGQHQPLQTPFGSKPLIYADYTASGRSLQFIEDYITNNVLPFYANTHTETSITGAQTTQLREDARSIIKKSINANAHDSVIFCGSGATSAINKLLDILDLRKTSQTYSQPGLLKPIVFIGPYEHHSNELPWRESIADVVTIPLNSHGQIDVGVLVEQLHSHRDRPLKIGSFSAASNVTGIISDVTTVTATLKKHNALSFWDYAAAAPYTSIDMNGTHPIDAVFISPHKFIGGPGTPGVLAVKTSLLKNAMPVTVGGGTVSYVTPEHHTFIHDHERREEGGTPAIVESIRAGLVFKLQQDVGIDTIEERETQLVKKAMTFLNHIPQIEVLGDHTAKRLSIFSLRFKYKTKELHYGFVTALLNDLFGIQVRGGCSCAGPYGHHLLQIDRRKSVKIESAVQQGYMALRPGWVRLNFNYFISDEEFDYLLNAIKLVAQHGWRMLPYYQLDRSSNWCYQGKRNPLPNTLMTCSFTDKTMAPPKTEKPNFEALLNNASGLLASPDKKKQSFHLNLPLKIDELRGFVLPQECFDDLMRETSIPAA